MSKIHNEPTRKFAPRWYYVPVYRHEFKHILEKKSRLSIFWRVGVNFNFHNSGFTSTRFTSRMDQKPRYPKVRLIGRLLELIRISHTVFALPFAILGFVLASVTPRSTTSGIGWQITCWRFVGVILCMLTARSAAMAFNRLVDARIDAENPRTSQRHLPTGELRPQQVWLFFAGMCVGFVAACLIFLPNWLPLALSVPVLLWICGYSFAKRFTSAAHLWLGIALAVSPPCAWLALRGEEVLANPSDLWPSVWIGMAIAFWVTGFDIIYACQDAEFDRRSGLHSVPAVFGVAGALRIAGLFHSAMLAVLIPLPWIFPALRLGWFYLVALGLVGVLLFVQHRLISPSDLDRVNISFFNINAFISLGLCSAAALDAILG